MRYYNVAIAGEYDFVKRDDNIKAARAWAKRAFPGKAITVSRTWNRQFCDYCDSTPCCCMVRADV